MAASPQFKVFNPSGEYVAACKFPEDAAAIVAAYGDDAKIKDGHAGGIVWHEGKETMPAGESYDNVAEVVYARSPGAPVMRTEVR